VAFFGVAFSMFYDEPTPSPREVKPHTAITDLGYFGFCPGGRR
jgi:hypothetical protein